MLPFARMLEFGNEIPAPVLPLIGKIETVTGITVPDSSMQHAVYDSVHNRMYTSGDNLIRYYDFSTNTWTTMGNRQGGSSGYNARRGAGLVIAGERVYVFGGGSAGCWQYIISSNTWKVISTVYPVVGANQTLALVGTGLDDLNRYMWCSTSTNLYKIT